MTNQLKKRYIGIDLLRGVCILYIVGFLHMLNYTKAVPNYDNTVTIKAAYIILGTFVFISGYFIGLKNLKLNLADLWSFYQKRLLRIYPLYLIAIVLFTILGLSSSTTSLKAAFFISMIVGPAPKTLWFIAMLMLFYLISPLIISACRKFSARNLILSFFLLVAGLIIYDYITELLDYRVVMYLPSFILGVLTAIEYDKKVNTKNIYFLLVLFCISILPALLKTNHSAVDQLLNTPMILMSSYLLFIMFKGLSIRSGSVCRIVMLISYSSYCMYLFHRPVYIVSKKIYFPEPLLLQLVYLVLICLPIIVVASYAIQKIYDLTSDAFIDRLDKPKKSVRKIRISEND